MPKNFLDTFNRNSTLKGNRGETVPELMGGNNAKECLLWYYRDSNSNEIDMVIESDGKLHPLEIKRSINPGSELLNAFNLLDKASVPRGNGAILCMRPKLSALNAENYIVPIWMI